MTEVPWIRVIAAIALVGLGSACSDEETSSTTEPDTASVSAVDASGGADLAVASEEVSAGTDTGSDPDDPEDVTSVTDTGAESDVALDEDVGVEGDAGAEADAGSESDAGAEPDAGPPVGACDDYTLRRQALFGDLHVHTSYSFDSYSLRNPWSGPTEAYLYGRGESVSVPPYDADGQSTRPPLKIARPLDFMAVTDHAEFIGEVDLCTTEGSSAYNMPGCTRFRDFSEFEEENVGVDISFLAWGAALAIPSPTRPAFCLAPGVDCEAAQVPAWAKLRTITEAANDVAPCVFTAFHGYEYTGTVGNAMNHRNVIFKSADVPDRPVTSIDAQNWQDLALRLKEECTDHPTRDCEVLAIPHNPNYSGGNLFAPVQADGSPLDADAATLRAEMEPLVELIQVKEESECRNGFVGYGADEDEACDFEKRDHGVPFCQPGQMPCDSNQTPEDDDCFHCLRECEPGETGSDCVSPLDYVRNVLKEGMKQWITLNVNPYKLGFIGSTDTHNATPGNTDEKDYEGHHGVQDDEALEALDPEVGGFAVEPTPGGLAVVWAEENTRASIFEAMQRRETYATSGTRPTVRFFGGVPEDLCGRPDPVSVADAEGTPMGGDLAPVIDEGKVVLAVYAMQDPESAGLQQVHIVKTWIDDTGAPREKVYNITPEPEYDYSASVNLANCEPTGPSRTEICETWTDPDFNPARPATYYARVLQAPTCRWTTWLCLSQNIDCNDPAQAVEGCCDAHVPKTIQERAWTSPVYYEPSTP